MKTLKRIIILLLAGIFIIVLSFFVINDFQEYVLSSIYGEETVYANSYSTKAWKQIEINDPLNKVLERLGEPLEKCNEKDGSEVYYYSKQGPKNTNYRIRIIVINRYGKVIEKIEEFYLD